MRAPPHSVDSEQTLLSCCLQDPRILGVLDLPEEAFYVEPHRLVYRALIDLRAEGSVSVGALGERLHQRGELRMVGGAEGLLALVEYAGTLVGWEHHARIVQGHATRRALAAACEIVRQAATDPEADLDALQAQVERDILGVFRAGGSDEPLTMAAVMERVDVGLRARQAGCPDTRVLTGFCDLDRMLCLSPGDLVVLAGDASHGKTALALDVAEHVAARGERVLVFELEMLAETLGQRRIAAGSGIPLTRLRTEALQADQAYLARREMERLRRLALRIDERSGVTLAQVASTCRRQTARWGQLALVVVDYLQLLAPTDTRATRERQVAEVSGGLKALAKELRSVVLLVSSLNRDRGARRNQRPTRANLRDSGQIEFDADAIVFVFREDVADPDSPKKGIGEIIVDKQRNGPTGVVELAYLGERVSFGDLARGR